MTLEKPNGVVVVTRGWGGRLLMVPNTKDNHGKRERTTDMKPGEFSEVEGYQFLGGKIEDGETPEGAAIREAKEEGRVKIREEQLRESPFGLMVEQAERGQFGVQVYEAQLNLWQELVLRLGRGAVSVKSEDATAIRPRDLVVRELVMNSISVGDYAKINIA